LVPGLILALLVVGGALFAFDRRTPPPLGTEGDDSRRDATVNALDLSIDDLRQEPDFRRAIIAAYARMEKALTNARLPRRPSEAPREFLLRSLRELDASAGAASRLTELFEVAKFSDRRPTLQMRNEAIDALLAIRDELTAAKTSATPVTNTDAAGVPTPS
jgi:hypothetical protein